jgi:putative molybdopterin biosynthesis protein
VGSTAGLQAAKRGECDLAGIHLLDGTSGLYNRPFLNDAVSLIDGYVRSQGILYRRGDSRFENRTPAEIVALASRDPSIVMVNRNQGSGTRILIDRLLAGTTPSGYAAQPGNHSAVAAAIVQHRADWGVAIETMARSNDLGFIPIQDEHYDFAVPTSRWNRPEVRAFVELLRNDVTREKLTELGFRTSMSSQ